MSETSKRVELNWAGGVIRPGEGYGGRPENIPEGCPQALGAPGDAPARDRREVVCEDDVAAIFDKGPLTKPEAARQLGANTGASRATCYRALDETGRFASHLRFESGKVSWR
jgi:hypothetical protein